LKKEGDFMIKKLDEWFAMGTKRGMGLF